MPSIQQIMLADIAAVGGGPTFNSAAAGTPVSTTTTITDSFTIASGANLLLAFIGHRRDGTTAVTDSTWNGTEGLTFVQSVIDGDSNVLELWRRINPSTGTHNLVSNITGGNARMIQIFVAFASANATTPLGTPATASSATGSPSVTVGSVGATDLVVDCFITEDSGTITVGANQTSRATSITPGEFINMGSSTQAGADGGVMSWTETSARWAQIGVAVKP